MYEALLALLSDWNASRNERQKLQHAYLALVVLIVFTSGILSLFDANLSHTVVLVALFTAATFLANAVVWNLLQSSFVSKISSRPKRR